MVKPHRLIATIVFICSIVLTLMAALWVKLFIKNLLSFLSLFLFLPIQWTIIILVEKSCSLCYLYDYSILCLFLVLFIIYSIRKRDVSKVFRKCNKHGLKLYKINQSQERFIPTFSLEGFCNYLKVKLKD